MALMITIDKEQILKEENKFKPIEANKWHEFEIMEVSAAPAKDKASMNYIVKHEMVDGSDRSIVHYFNSKPFGMSFILKFYAAINGMPLKEFMDKLPAKLDVNLENTLGKRVMGKVIHALAADGSGKIFNNIEDWAPVGKVPF